MDIKDYIFNLYEIHSSDLIEVRKKQREFIKFVGEHQFDDLESESGTSLSSSRYVSNLLLIIIISFSFNTFWSYVYSATFNP